MIRVGRLSDDAACVQERDEACDSPVIVLEEVDVWVEDVCVCRVRKFTVSAGLGAGKGAPLPVCGARSAGDGNYDW
jgi:hypothetical protein